MNAVVVEGRPESFIAGRWEAGDGEPFAKTCPASGDVVWEGRAASAGQVARAVEAARSAQAGWADADQTTRNAFLLDYAEALATRRAEIAQLISQDMGKTLGESLAEADAMASKIRLSISALEKRAGCSTEQTSFGELSLAHRPHGVLAVFGPFNFPGHLPNGHLTPALLAGNTCVFKPSELAPSVAAVMMECFEAAGLPQGCVNMVHGGRETGSYFLNSEINGVLFTGSEGTGLAFHRHFAGRPEVMLALELGGNNPLVIWEPADVEAAAGIAIQSAFLTTGQRCTCARRLILPEGAFGDAVIDAVVDRARALPIGSWQDEGAFMGPVVSSSCAARALAFQEGLVRIGAAATMPMRQLDERLGFLSAGLLDMQDAQAPDEECFAPLLQIYRAPTIEAAISVANATRFGLSASVVCDDDSIWESARKRLRAGILNRNRPTVGASGALPFGGPGVSGNFRPGGFYAADYCAWPQSSQIAPRAR